MFESLLCEYEPGYVCGNLEEIRIRTQLKTVKTQDRLITRKHELMLEDNKEPEVRSAQRMPKLRLTDTMQEGALSK